MPHKGFFTQAAIILVDGPVSPDDVERALVTFDVVGRKTVDDPNWMWAAESVIVPLREEVNGYLAVDVIDKPWPDGMGDPKEDVELFAGWSMGHFGPFTFPKSLARAVAQNRSMQNAKDLVARHRGFIRIRSTYAIGASDHDPVMPDNYEPLFELERITDVAVALLEVPQALCYYNPNGETLYTAQIIQPIRAHYRRLKFPALDLWCNLRMWNFEDAANTAMVESVGMQQLDLADHEAVFIRGKYQKPEVAEFVRNATLYIAQNGPVIKDGETTDGPGGHWRAKHFETGVVAPPRPVLRWFPQDGSKFPDKLTRAT
jgi:hypothetical protein